MAQRHPFEPDFSLAADRSQEQSAPTVQPTGQVFQYPDLNKIGYTADPDPAQDQKPASHPSLLTDYGWRGLGGGLLDWAVATDGSLSQMWDKGREEYDGALRTIFGQTPKHLALDYSTGKFSWQTAEEMTAADASRHQRLSNDELQLAPAPERGGAQFARGVTEFATNFIPATRALSSVSELGGAYRITSGLAASALSVFNQARPEEGNLANLAEHFGVDKTEFAQATHFSDLLDGLAVKETDSPLMARYKNVAADFGANVALEGVSKVVRSLRALKVGQTELQAIKDAESVSYAPQSQSEMDAALQERVAPTPEPAAAHTAPAADGAAPKYLAEDTGALGRDPTISAPEARPQAAKVDPKDPEAAVQAMQDKLKTLDPEELRQFVEDFHGEKPYEALQRVGLYPEKLDLGGWLAQHATPEVAQQALTALLDRIATTVKPLADELGPAIRTDKSVAASARMLGTSVQELSKSLVERTTALPQMLVAHAALTGGEAQKLTSMALMVQKAEAWNSPGSALYLEFLKQLETVSSLVAYRQTAASNMGRGLRSLQIVSKARDAIDREAVLRTATGDAEGGAKLAPVTPEEDRMAQIGNAKTPKARQDLIESIIKNQGDVAKVVAAADRMSGWGRFFSAARESTSGLFSLGTFFGISLSASSHAAIDLVSKLAVHPLAFALGKGGTPEFVASRYADLAYTRALLPSLGTGIVRAVQHVVETVGKEVGRAADGFGDNAVGTAAPRIGKSASDALGSAAKTGEYFPYRADFLHDPAIYISPETIAAWREAPDHAVPFYTAFGRTLARALAPAINVGGAVVRGARLLPEAADSIFGHGIAEATRTAEATRIATRQSMMTGATGQDLKRMIQSRADALMESTSKEAYAAYENASASVHSDPEVVKELAQRALDIHQMDKVSVAQARKVLFQDSLRSGLARSAATAMNQDRVGVIFPFVRTPLRQLEIGLGEYTPVGLAQRELWQKLNAGGPDGLEALMKVGLGISLTAYASHLFSKGLIVGYDGGPNSSARLERPQYAMKLGDRWVSFNRAEPLAMAMGFGADLAQMHERAVTTSLENGQDPRIEQWYGVMANAIATNVLSKTTLTSLRNWVELAEGKVGRDEGQASKAWDKIAEGLLQRIEPASGLTKGWAQENNDAIKYANTFQEKLFTNLPWLHDTLEDKRDPLLGRPVTYDRTLGMKVGKPSDKGVLDELARLSFNMPADAKSIQGVGLTSAQMSRLNQLRGQEVQLGGQTLDERLTDAVKDPSWNEQTDAEKQRLISKLRSAYQARAEYQLMDEQPDLKVAVKSRQYAGILKARGTPTQQIPEELKRFQQEVLNN